LRKIAGDGDQQFQTALNAGGPYFPLIEPT